MRLRLAVLAIGALASAAALVLARRAGLDAAANSWQPFVLVTGLLLIGVVANQDGLFSALAGLIERLPGGDLPLYAVSMLVVAVVTALLNLDTSVAFLTPVLVLAARRRGAGELRFLYGCVFMSNAASLLLPGSNLTNLLVLAGEHRSGSTFLARMFLPWTASVLVTGVVVAIAFRGGSGGPVPQPGEHKRPAVLSLIVVGAALALILLLPDSALPVLLLGVGLVAIRLIQQRIGIRTVLDQVDLPTLAGVFLLAVALGTVARTWDAPQHLMAGAGSITTAVIAALASVVLNNLPAAVLLGSHVPGHPRSLLIGLNLGPNLAVTGSLSALIWWRAAMAVGARPSALRYSKVGLVLVPASIAAALVAGRLTG